jgi:deoxyadenosine/deoxycytidine kinase
LLQRIALRGRDYERQISAEYLEQINELYEIWIARFNLCPVLTVPADNLDYASNPTHLDLIERKILDKLMGKEEVVFSLDEVG